MVKIEKYSKNLNYSYSLGAFPTYELVCRHPEQVEGLLLSTRLNVTKEVQDLLDLCKKHNIPVEYNDKAISKISDKENCFIAGVFNKYVSTFKDNKQVVLVNPSNSGNLGTIMRTMLGFGIKDLSIIKPCVDYFDPKTVRASMGAVFGLNIVEFENVEDYLKSNNYKKFFFMLNGKTKLGQFETPTENYTLVFGNEAHGLPDELLDVDQSVVIEHSKEIDSLNLPISVGMAIYEFRGKHGN